MKKYVRIIYVLVMAALVLSVSGCEWDDDDDQKKKSSSATEDKLIVVTSSALKKGESYIIYRGDKVQVTGTKDNAKYYVAPIGGTDEPVTMNLLFKKALSEDLPFVIATADEDYAVVISYNPDGAVFSDTTTEYRNVIRTGGGTQKLQYSGLKVAGASVNSSALAVDTSDETVIILDDSTASIVSGDEEVPVEEFDFVWHIDPSRRGEYYTDGIDGDEVAEEDMFAEIFNDGEEEIIEDDESSDDESETDVEESALNGNRNGVKAYIAHDIRYMPSTLNFESLISADGKTEYAAYYSDTVAEEAYEELGEGFNGSYILATLPMIENISEDEESGDAEVSSALNNTEIQAFSMMTHSAQKAYNNPVLHIVEPGTYRISGKWFGQICLDAGASGDVTLILDGVAVSCDVGPAVVFNSARECEPERYNASFDVGYDLKYDAGARLVIANKSSNSIYGTNVYRILAADKADDRVTAVDGSDVYQQRQICRMDGAIYSSVSLAVGAESNIGGGKLSISSKTYKGLCSDTHLLTDGGTITVSALSDGISTNGYDSVFTMNSGNLAVTSRRGGGIYSGSYIVLKNGTVDITSAKDSELTNSGETGPLSAGSSVYISENVTYNHQAYETSEGDENTGDQDNSGEVYDGTDRVMNKQTVTVRNENRDVVLRINFTTPVKDEETEKRTISSSGNVFLLEHTVNSFSGITEKEE